jgi:hypothetical protein
MAETLNLDKKRAAERRLALLALTGEQPKPSGLCLDAEQLACLVEGRLAAGNVEACLAHLADCEQCYATWRQLDQEWQQGAKGHRPDNLLKWFNRPRLLATTGSILALAASIAVFLSITMESDRESLLRLPAQPAQEQKQIAPPAEAKIERPLSLEQSTAPAPQQLEKQREKKPLSRTDRVQAKEQEAAAQAKASAQEADRTAAARKAPAAAVRAAPPLQAETASADKVTEKKGKISDMVAKEAAPSPAPPRLAAQGAREESANITEAEPLTLIEWQRMIREGCQGQPQPDFFTGITAKGRQLLARKDAIMATEDRQQVSRVLNLLATRHQQPAAQQCQALLELLGPVAGDDITK